MGILSLTQELLLNVICIQKKAIKACPIGLITRSLYVIITLMMHSNSSLDQL